MSMSDIVDRDTVAAAAIAGAAAWILGYTFTYILVGTDVSESGLNRVLTAFDGDPATYELVGWIFYNAHGIDIVYTGLGGAFLPATYIGGSDGATVILYALPLALLVAAGLAVGRLFGITALRDGAVAGGFVAVGYLLFTVAGVLSFEVSTAGTTGRPAVLPAIVIAGLLYPIIFGAAGGMLAATTNTTPGQTTPETSR